MAATKLSVIFMISFTVVLQILRADGEIAEHDEYWRQRKDEARRAALETYKPDPMSVTTHFSVEYREKLFNSSRRHLESRKIRRFGPCSTFNSIDDCWRCDRNWAMDRKKIVKCVLGFAKGVTGGAAGEYYIVTDPSDDDVANPKVGTLRWGVIQPRPLWIIFARSMRIKLTRELIFTSDKTIDGRGANVYIVGGDGLTLQFIRNVIIHNIHIHDIRPTPGGMIRDSTNHVGFRTMSDGDGISIFGSSLIWIDHVSMSNCSDGLIDAIEGSTGITISNSHFTKHNDVILLGAHDDDHDDSKMQVTVAYNHFGKGLIQRMPRIRFGFVHIVNNDYTHWIMYAIGGSSHPTIISQGNRFIAPLDLNAKQVTSRHNANEDEWKTWTWISENDLFLNGAYFVPSGNPANIIRTPDMIPAKAPIFISLITRYAGTLNCVPGRKC